MNIRNFNVLQEYERKFSDLRKITVHEIKGNFDKDHICRIHKHLFGDIYDWAGHIRNVDLWKDDMAFAAVKDIDEGLEDLHATLEADNYLIGMNDKNKASQALTNCFVKLNHIHPFREGNGRTTRAVLSMLAENAGFELSFSHVGREEWIYASRLAEYGTDFVMRDILRNGLEKVGNIEAGRRR